MTDQDPSWPSEPAGGQPPTPPPAPGGGGPGGGGFTPTPAGGGDIDPRSGLPYADFGKRAGAYLIDIGVVIAVYVVIFILTLILGAIADILGLLMSLVGFAAYIGLFVVNFLLGEGGPLSQSLGKHMMGIKVVGDTPGPIGIGKSAMRNIVGRFLDSIVCGIPIGVIWPLFDDENRAWHDIIADTRVVVAPTGEKSPQYWLANFRG